MYNLHVKVLVDLKYVLKAPTWYMYSVPDVSPFPMKKKFAVFHARNGHPVFFDKIATDRLEHRHGVHVQNRKKFA